MFSLMRAAKPRWGLGTASGNPKSNWRNYMDAQVLLPGMTTEKTG